MPFIVRVNGQPEIVAGFNGTGSIGVHLVEYPGGKTPTGLRVRAFRNAAPHETESIDWGEIKLHPGDTVTVRHVIDAEPTSPTQRKSSRDDERICVHDSATAGEIADLVRGFCDQLFELVPRVEAQGSEDDVRQFTHAVGHVVSVAYEHILTPIFNRHTDLAPAEHFSSEDEE